MLCIASYKLSILIIVSIYRSLIADMMLRLEQRLESILVTMGPCQQLIILDGYWAVKLMNQLFAPSRRYMKSSFMNAEKLVKWLKISQ